MRKSPCVISLLLICASVGAQQLHVEGSVQSHKPSIQSLGRGLVLVVTTDSIEVQLAPYQPAGSNLAQCVTPPFHGPNAIYLDAWLFDPQRNDAEAAHRREFSFTTKAADDKRACDELEVVLYEPPVKVNGVSTIGTPGYKEPALGHGVLTLSNIRFSRPVSAQDSEIISFNFSAEITLPPLGKMKRK